MRGLVSFEEKFTIFSELFDASHFLIELWIDHEMEVVIDLLQLCDIFILHLSTGSALAARVLRFRETYLVYDNIVNIYFEFG